MEDLAAREVPQGGPTTRWVEFRRVRLESVCAALLLATLLLPGPGAEGAALEDRLQAVGPGVHLRTIVWQDEGEPAGIHRVQLLTIDRSYLAPLGPLVISAKAPAMPSILPSTATGTDLNPAGGTVSASPGTGDAGEVPPAGTTATVAGSVTSRTTWSDTMASAFPPVSPVLVAGLQEEVPEALAVHPGLAGIRISDGELIHASSGVPAVGILLNGQPVSGLPLLWAKAEPLRPGGVPYLSVSIDRVNLDHGDGISYYTPRFGKSTGTEPGTTEFVLAGKGRQPLTRPGPDAVFEAVVVSVRRSGNSTIPPDGAVLAVSGPEASRLAGYLTNGQTVRLTFQLIPGQWRSAREVVPGEHVLLAGRVVRQLPADAPGVNTPAARIALAYNERSILLVTVDDTGSVSGPEWAGAPDSRWRTSGLTLSQFARLLQDLGMSDAVALPDRFVLQQPSPSPSIPASAGTSVRYDSLAGTDGTVGVWNTAPAGPLVLLDVEADAQTILAGSRFAVRAKGLDTGFHPVALPVTSLSWSVVTSNASLDTHGTTAYFSARSPGRVTVRAEVLTAGGSRVQKNWEGEIIAADRLQRITISPATALIAPGNPLALTVTGWDEAGRPVYVDPALLVWDVPASVGRIDASTGTLLPSMSVSTLPSSKAAGSGQDKVEAYPAGVIRASLRTRPELAATVAVAISPDPEVLTDVTAKAPQWTVIPPQAGYLRVVTAPTPRPRGVGPLMLRPVLQPVLQSGASTHELLLRPQLEQKAGLSLDDATRFVGMWVHVPQEQEVALVAEWVDATGRAATSSFAPWETRENPGLLALLGVTVRSQSQLEPGWHFLLAPLPSAAPPVALTGIRIRFSQPRQVGVNAGLPAVGALLAIPTAPPMATNPPMATTPTASASSSPTSGMAGTPPSTTTVAATTVPVAESLAAPPVHFANVQPADGQSTPTSTPRLSARLKPAPGWEVDSASLRLSLDAKPVWNRELASSDWGRLVYGEGAFDRASGVFWFMPAQPLLPGSHEARLELTLVSAVQGGPSPPAPVTRTAELRWRFTVSPPSFQTGALTRPLRIAVVGGPALSGIPDEAGERIFREITRRLHDQVAPQEAPDLVVFPGDMVATNNEALYARASQVLQTLGIPYLVIPGKRDLSGGDPNRDRFLQTWGHAPMRLDIGTTRLLLLDTVNGVGGYDPTQWDWLSRQLAETPGSQINRYVIFSYLSPLAPAPADGRSAWPSSEESQKLTSLLAAVRQAALTATPAKTPPEILFVSGSPAAFLAQQDKGILYLTSGGGGRQLEAEPEAGGFYHWLELTLPADGPAEWSVVPLVQSVTLAGLPEKLRQGASSSPWAVVDLYTASRSPVRVTVRSPLSYEWSVSDPRLAAIDPQTGQLTAKAPGQVKVTLEVGGVIVSRQVEIIPPAPTTSVSESI